MVGELIARECPLFGLLDAAGVEDALGLLGEVDGFEDPYGFMCVADDCKGAVGVEIDEDHEGFTRFVHTIEDDTRVVMVHCH